MNDNLRQLKELTEELPVLEDMVKASTLDTVEYDISGGECIGIGLFKSDKVSVQRTLMNKGAYFPCHKHEENEWIHVYEGKIEVTTPDGTFEFGPGGFAFFPRETIHSVKALKNTWMIGVAIPAIGGYPDADRQQHA